MTTARLRIMEKSPDHSVLRTLLILFLSLALLVAQTNRMHMHLEHDDHAELSWATSWVTSWAATTDQHIVNVHSTTLLHDFESMYHSDNHNDQHSAAIDVGPDNLNQKIKLSNPLLLMLLFIGLILFLGRLVCRLRQAPYIKHFTSRYYLLQPPLRAPPLI